MSELKQSTRQAIAWSAVDKAAQQLIALVVSLTAMRWWLAPEDFGLLAPLALFSAVAALLAEGGFSLALLRKTDASERDYNTMFWFNVGLSVLFYFVLFALAPLIARYNRMPELTPVARVQFLSVVCSSLGMIHITLLFKRNDFRRIAQANVISVVFYALAVIVLGMLGFGVWAIVGQSLAMTVSKTVALWFLTRWRPRLMFCWSAVRQVFGFSSKLILGSLAATFSGNFYNAALGDHIPRVQLGFYDRACGIKDTVNGFLSHIFGHSVVVMLTRLQDEPERYRAAWRKSIRALSFLLFPATLGLWVTVAPLIEVVITAKWLPAVPYIRLLCFSGLLVALSNQHANALKIRGRTDITLIADLANAVLVVVFLLSTIRHGLQAAILANIVLQGLIYLYYGTASARILGYHWVDQLRDLAPYAGLSAAMAAAVWPLQSVIANKLLLVAAQVGLGAVIYLGATYLLGSKVFDEVRQMARKRRDNTI